MIRSIEDIAYDYAGSIVENTGGDPENQVEVINVYHLILDFLDEVEQNWPSRKDNNGTVPKV